MGHVDHPSLEKTGGRGRPHKKYLTGQFGFRAKKSCLKAVRGLTILAPTLARRTAPGHKGSDKKGDLVFRFRNSNHFVPALIEFRKRSEHALYQQPIGIPCL
jgi:hypothetical protein